MSESAAFAVCVACFCVCIAAFTVVMVRHYKLMQVLRITLMGIEENHRLFNEALEIERARQSKLAPD